MVSTKAVIWGAWFCGVWMFVGAAEAEGQTGPSPSLRMRPSAPATAQASPRHASKRVGQAPAPDEPPDADRLDDRDAPGSAGLAPPGVVPAGPGLADGEATDGEATDGEATDGAATDGAARRRSPAPLTVTGSLIERATLTTPAPLTILGRDDLLAAGRTMIGDILQPRPEQGNALNAQFNNGGDGSTRINLRGLGIPRTLTLLNGRRFVNGGTGADTSVDLNTIPLAVIERVEILRDAGSAVYGSDAIGGVVNIITRTDFRGTEASLYTAQTEREDGFTVDASFITGHRTEDRRGHIIFSAETQRQEPVSAGDREFSRVTRTLDFTSGTTVLTGSSATPNGRLNTRPNGGPQITVPGCTTRFCTSDGNGGFRNFISPTATSFGDNYNFQPSNQIYTPSARSSAYTAGSYKLSPGVKGFFEASFQHRASSQQLAPEPLFLTQLGLPISRGSIFNPLGVDVLDYNRRLEEFGPRRFVQSVDTLRTVVGVRGEGKAPDSWKWELSYNYGRSDATRKNEGSLILSRLGNAIGPSFVDFRGVPTCGTPSAPIFGCVPIHLLGPSGSISPEGVEYAGFTGLNAGVNKQQEARATVQRRIARLPNRGDVSLAVTADVRREIGDFTPDALIASGDTTAFAPPAVHGSTQVAEAAAELSIVPVRDRDGVERIELDLAARAFRYDSFGDGVTSSARALVRPVRGITLRASRSTAFRAPSIGELFEAQADFFPLATDPCDNSFGAPDPTTAAECARQGVAPDAFFGTSQQRAHRGGNPNVQPETAEVMTAGVVLESPRARGLSLSVDFWNIELTQAIQQPLIQNVFANCYQRGIRSFCDLIHRDPAQGFAIDFVDLTFANFGGTSTQGVDTAVNVDHHVPGLGDLHARLDVQNLRRFDLDTGSSVVHGLGVYDLGVYPKRKANLSALWRHPRGAAAGFNFQFIDSFQECESNDCSGENPSRTVESYSKLDVFSTVTFRRFGGETTLTIGVNNVLDRQPPVIFNGAAGNYDEATYDFLGRFAYARLTQQF